MFDFKNMNHKLQKITYIYFEKCCQEHQIIISQNTLEIILKIIQNNPYSLMNEEYYPILLSEIGKETNIDIVDKIKPMIVEKYLLELLV
ncbi:MAG: DUF2624 domain-containing protein [Erysipelotrichaceae bacterium]|nr:DUF2624 domain-containing protein [Erysipelotrichaceae bacterium]